MAVAKRRGEEPKVRETLATEAAAEEAPLRSPDPAKTAPGPQSAGRWLYADNHLVSGDTDSLGLGAYANALALLMDTKKTSTPLTIAINGPWGSGKTSLAKMAEARLPFGSDWNKPHITCWFDAWANDDAPHLGAAFAAAVAKAANKERRRWRRFLMPLPSAMLSPEERWRRRLWLGIFAVILAAAVIFLWPDSDSLINSLLKPKATTSDVNIGKTATHLAGPVLAIAVVALARNLLPGIQGVARWIDNPGSESAKGSMQDVKRQLGRFINQSLRDERRLIIFVDNLERCRPPRAVEVCEVVSQLIGHREVVTVLIGDMDTIASSAEIKYAELESISTGHDAGLGMSRTASRGAPGTYGRAYLEKLIQIQLSLPPPLVNGLREMLVPVTNGTQAFPYVPVPSSSKPRSSTPFIMALCVMLGYLLLIPLFLLDYIVPAVRAYVHHHFFWFQFSLAVFFLFSFGATAWYFHSADRGLKQIQQRRDTVDKLIASKVELTETTLRQDVVEQVSKQVIKDSDTIEMRLYIQSEIRRRIRQHIILGSELRAELDRAVLKILPLSPRAAKRMFNHAHLLLDIGVERGIFDSTPALQADHLAVWVALTERWPSVAADIARDPELIGRLEEAARQTSLIVRPEQLTALEKAIQITGLDTSLLDYLRQAVPLLPVIHLLVNFAPVTDQTPAPSTQPAKI